MTKRGKAENGRCKMEHKEGEKRMVNKRNDRKRERREWYIKEVTERGREGNGRCKNDMNRERREWYQMTKMYLPQNDPSYVA